MDLFNLWQKSFKKEAKKKGVDPDLIPKMGLSWQEVKSWNITPAQAVEAAVLTKSIQGVTSDVFKPKWSYPTRRAAEQYAEMFHTNPGFSALDLIADTCASAQFNVYIEKYYQEDADTAVPLKLHWLKLLISDPMPENQELDGYTLMYLTVVYLGAVGEFFWAIERDTMGVPRRAYPVPPSWVVMTPTLATPTFKILPTGNISQGQIEVSSDSMIWFKKPNVVSPYARGRGRAEAIGDELEADELSAKYQKNLMYNDAQPPLMITMPEADSATLEQFKAGWLSRVGGYTNARKPVFLNTAATVQKLTDSPRELDMVESRKYFRDVFNQHFNLPPEMRGIIESSNRATIDAAYYLYSKNVITRELNRIQAILTKQLLRTVKMDAANVVIYDSVIPEEEQTKFNNGLLAFNAGVLTEDEFRRLAGWKPATEGGDKRKPAQSQGFGFPPGEGAKKKSFSLDRQIIQKKMDSGAVSMETAVRKEISRLASEQLISVKARFKTLTAKGMDPKRAIQKAIDQTYTKERTAEEIKAMIPLWEKGAEVGAKIAQGLINE